jgi:hypothetical protein
MKNWLGYNYMERLRDPSHTQALSPSGLKKIIEDAGAKILNYYSREVENSVDDYENRRLYRDHHRPRSRC